MTLFAEPAIWLPVAFAVLMGLSILVYVVLDGFDLGVGILLPLADGADKDRMVASIGPFWDANETWLVLAVGLLLVAFPAAHGMILTALYLPVAVMLIGLILRGVAFEFRAKAPAPRKALWDRAFFAGSVLTALAQGFMLGLYVMGLSWTAATVAFGLLTALCLASAYAFIGREQFPVYEYVWPTREETIRTAIFVFIMTLLLSLFFLGIDSAFNALVNFLLTLA